MSELSEVGFQVPEHVRQYLQDLGYVLPLDPMDEHVREWEAWMAVWAVWPSMALRLGLGRDRPLGGR